MCFVDMNPTVVKPTVPVPIPQCFLCSLGIKAGTLRVDYDIATGNIVGKIIMKS